MNEFYENLDRQCVDVVGDYTHFFVIVGPPRDELGFGVVAMPKDHYILKPTGRALVRRFSGGWYRLNSNGEVCGASLGDLESLPYSDDPVRSLLRSSKDRATQAIAMMPSASAGAATNLMRVSFLMGQSAAFAKAAMFIA